MGNGVSAGWQRPIWFSSCCWQWCGAKTASPLVLCMAAVGAGLLYDAVMIALGAVWEGPVHLAFSQLRFVSHGVLIPLLFPICAYALGAGRKVLGAV